MSVFVGGIEREAGKRAFTDVDLSTGDVVFSAIETGAFGKTRDGVFGHGV